MPRPPDPESQGSFDKEWTTTARGCQDLAVSTANALREERQAVVKLLEARHEAILQSICARLQGQVRVPAVMETLQVDTATQLMAPQVDTAALISEKKGGFQEQPAQEKDQGNGDRKQEVQPLKAKQAAKAKQALDDANIKAAIEAAAVEAEAPRPNKVKTDLHGVFEAEIDTRPWPERFVEGTIFEMFFGFLIVLNTLQMCAEAEYRGWATGHTIGPDAKGQPTTQFADSIFYGIEMFFLGIFTFEVGAKLLALRLKFWKQSWNIFDFVIISIAWMDLFMSMDFFLNPMLLRLIRLVRLMRLLRSLKQFEIFDNLHLMVRGIKAALPVLIWVFVLMFPLLACCALGMNYTLLEFMEDEANSPEVRLKLYGYFGTFSKAFLSMFEVSFASWVPITRFMYDKVDPSYAIFFMIYKLVVGIAVLRIVYGVFLHVTFACASSDDETLIAKKEREMKKYANKMHSLFLEMDNSGDGYLSRMEFARVCQDPRVQTWLSAMELELDDADLVYDLTDDGNDKLSASEMVMGFSKLKGPARSIDIQALISLVRQEGVLVRKAVEKLNQIDNIVDKKVLAAKDALVMDQNKDGVVDKDEFLAGGGTGEQFARYDLNGDGVLDDDDKMVDWTTQT